MVERRWNIMNVIKQESLGKISENPPHSPIHLPTSRSDRRQPQDEDASQIELHVCFWRTLWLVSGCQLSVSCSGLLCWRAAVALVGAKVAEAASALLAAVGCGSAVDPLVGIQVPQLLKAPAALRTSVRALTGVHPLVSLKSGEHWETFPTLGAGEGALGTAVDQPVAF